MTATLATSVPIELPAATTPASSCTVEPVKMPVDWKATEGGGRSVEGRWKAVEGQWNAVEGRWKASGRCERANGVRGRRGDLGRARSE